MLPGPLKKTVEHAFELPAPGPIPSVFGYFKTKKCSNESISSRGGGGVKALVVEPLAEKLFFAASLSADQIKTNPQVLVPDYDHV